VIGEGQRESAMTLGLPVLDLPLALAALPLAQAQNPARAPKVEPARAAPPEKPAATALAVDRQLPTSPDPRVCLEYTTSAEVIMCAEKYRPRKRQA
jgi:hypothetical protein